MQLIFIANLPIVFSNVCINAYMVTIMINALKRDFLIIIIDYTMMNVTNNDLFSYQRIPVNTCVYQRRPGDNHVLWCDTCMLYWMLM